MANPEISSQATSRQTTGRQTSPLLITAAWLVVLLPASWGLRYTVANALKLFATPAAATAAPGSPAAH